MICPWWFTYTFDNPLRRLVQDPHRILEPYVREGMVCADIGCGMGYFTVEMARLVGDSGRVFAVDLQHQQLRRVESRARRAGVRQRVELVQASETSLGLSKPLHFALLFAVLHEAPDTQGLLLALHNSLAEGAVALIAEPIVHVPASCVERSRRIALQLGFEELQPQAPIALSHLLALRRVPGGRP
jgi:2-polyprenyl-3-methyl-5-hydroxy-6-metoxy-1,4-benzoquinol methylase